MKTKLCWWQKLMAAVMCAVMLQPWGAYRLMAADVTPGYTFTAGEANVTHTKLNNATAGTIATTFYSGKSAAGANMTPGNYTLLGLDSVSGTYRRATLDQWVFDHSALIADRSVSTAPLVGYTLLFNNAGAYGQMSWTNWMFSGAGTGAITNDTRFPALRAGVASSLSLSNMIGAAFSHDTPTNGDEFLVLTENHNRAVRKLSLKNLVTASWPGTNYSGTDQMLTYDGTRLRSMRGTNFIDGLTVTNTAPLTNDALTVLQAGQLKKLFLNELRNFIGSNYVVQTVCTNATNILSGGWSNVVDTGGVTLSATMTPRSTNSLVLVRVALMASSSGSADNGYMRVLRGLAPIGVGAAGGSRIQAGASVPNLADAAAVVWEWLDNTGATNTTYTVQVQAVSGNQIYINRDSSDGNTAANGRYVSTLTLTEIFQ